jgi:hypothetical protein
MLIDTDVPTAQSHLMAQFCGSSTPELAIVSIPSCCGRIEQETCDQMAKIGHIVLAPYATFFARFRLRYMY